MRMPLAFRSCIRSAMLLGLSFFLIVPGGRAQTCDNNDSIYSSGQYCITGGTSPQMPALSYTGSSGTCSSEYTMELDFAQPGDSYGNGKSYGYYDSGALPANTRWLVDWSMNQGDVGEYSEGGNGDLRDVEDGNLANEFTFFVYGQDPATSSITASLGLLGTPWWYGHTLTQESSNRQFYYWQSQHDPSGTYTGTPVFGPLDGFGLAQIDGSGNPTLLTDDVMWTWTTNLIAGVGLANASQSGGITYWGIQQGQEYSFETQNGLQRGTDAPNAFNGTTYCTFMPTGTGHQAYSNGYGIAGYNIGNPDDPAPGGGLKGDDKGFASFQLNTGGWFYHAWNYVTLVCNQPSMTLPQ